MKFGWAGFFGAGRLRAIERDMADMRATLAMLVAQATADAERALAAARTISGLTDRIAALEKEAGADRAALRKLAGDGLVIDGQMEVQGEEMVRLRTALMRMERQLEDQAEEGRKIATGLLERIEAGARSLRQSGYSAGEGV